MLTENNHLKRKHQNDGNAEDGGHAEKRKVEKGFCFFSLLKVGAHNRVPSRQLYY